MSAPEPPPPHARRPALPRSWAARLNLRPTLRLVWESSPRWCMVNGVLFVAQGLLPLAFLYLTKLILDSLAERLGTADPEAAIRELIPLVIAVAVVALVTTLINALAELANTALTQTVTDHMFSVLHAKAVEVDLSSYESSRYHDILRRAEREAPYRPARIVQGLRQLIQNGVSMVAILGLMLTLHWWIAVVVLAISIPAIVVRFVFIGKLYRWQRRRTSTERMAQYFHSMMTTLWYAKEIRLFSLGKRFRERFSNLRGEMRRELISIATRRSMASFGVQAAMSLLVFGVYLFLVDRTVRGILTIGDLALYHQAFQKGRSSLQEMLTSLAGLYESNLFLTDLYELLSLEPEVVEPDSPAPVPRPIEKGIVFHHVGFHYPETTRRVLGDVDLELKPGETIALVGRNGAGKTTLVKLLCRLYEPTEGQITVDGVDLRELGLEDWRSQVAVVFQDYARYQLTARENIGFGNPTHLGDDARLHGAAHQANIDGVLKGLPQGYDTILGKWFEGGEELSLGEWQKVALARAFLRDAPIVVLDEPTSALDPHAEDEIIGQLRRLAEGRTAILVSHRLTTVMAADRIYVLDDGRIVERGTHDELVRLDGVYARLFEAQARSRGR